MTEQNPTSKSMTTAAFSKHVLCVDDLYNAAVRNGYFLPQRKSSAVNEIMLVNVLKGQYWCPKSLDIRIKNCVRAPVKETLMAKLATLCQASNHNIAWIDDTHYPDKKWMVAVIGTLDPGDEIFKKDYVAPAVRKRLRDIETIVLPNEIFEGLPQSTSKVKARRMKIMSEAFAAEKAVKYKELQKELYEQMVEQEERRENFKKRMEAKNFQLPERILEEKKKGEKVKDSQVMTSASSSKQRMNPSHGIVNPFTLPPPTPRGDDRSSMLSTPMKFKSPNSQIKDLSQSFDAMNASMSSPPKDALNTSINPQSQNHSKRK